MENEKIEPNYYAIIPASVRYANISSSAKLLYGEITALCNKEGYSWATNTYFANLYKVSRFTISRWISELRDNNLIVVDIIKQEKGKEVSRKLIIKEQHLLTKTATPIAKNRKGGVDENRKENNTSTNNTNNNTITSNEVSQIIEFFNSLFEKKYRITPDRKKKIKLRLKSYTVDEIKLAIDNLSKSKFHNGDNDRGWVADIDFIIRNDEQIDKFLNNITIPENNNYYRDFNIK